MWKLIKMDFYRLFSGKAIKVGAIVSFLISAGYIFMSLGIIALIKLAFKTDPAVADSVGLLLSQASWVNGVDFSEIVFGGTSSLALFIGCMISANFIGSEQSCGYTKNFAGQLQNKGYMAVSKLTVTSLVHFIVLAIHVISCSVLGMLFLGQYINGYDLKTLFWALGLRLMLFLAVNAIIVFVCTLTRNHSIATVVGCVFGLGVTRFAYTTASLLLSAVKINIDIGNYMPDGINSMIALDTVADLTQRAIMLSVVFIAAFLAASYYVVRNRDVK